MDYKEKVINSQKELKLISKNENEIITKAKYGPSKETKIPLNLEEDLAFFVATIIGDGHLKKSKFQTSIELTDERLLNYIKKMCERLFDRKFNINKVKIRKGRKPTFVMLIDSKAIHNFLIEVFEIPSGKKSHIVKVPEHIKNSNEKIKLSFLKGIMATEGGKRRRGYGLSTASENLWKDLIILFEEINIPVLKDKWIYQKYKKEYYGISFRKEHMKKLNADVSEWSNEVGLGPTGLVPT